MAAARRSWIDRGTDIYLDELEKFGLHVPRPAVSQSLRKQVGLVAKALRVTEQSARPYFTEEALRDLARKAAVDLADEQPGADLWNAPRNIPTPARTLGRSVAALAEASRVRLANDDSAGPDDALALISLLGNFLSKQPSSDGDVILLPQAVLTRSARFLEATAEIARASGVVTSDLPVISAAELADAFEHDANMLRRLVNEHGFRSGPVTPG